MTIFVDEPRTWKAGFEDWCHLWSDTMDIAELDAFAKRLGLRAAWIQRSNGLTGPFFHYDLSPAKCALALHYGAQFKSLMEWLKEQRQKVVPHESK